MATTSPDRLPVDFFWDPMCPWAWITSRWVHEVATQRPIEVDWRLICLRIVNEGADYEKDFPPGYTEWHRLGQRLLRVAAAARDRHGPEAMGPLYTAIGSRIHVGKSLDVARTDEALADAVAEAGLDPGLVAQAEEPGWDDALRAETEVALNRAGRDIGTPVLTFGAPDGPSFFGPVISRIPRGDDAVRLWDTVVELAHFPGFAELKRSAREEWQTS